MFKPFFVMTILLALCWPALSIEPKHGILVGEILKIDSDAKTVVVKLADGTEHTLHFLGRTAVHGAHASATGTKEALGGLKMGSQVAVHYTAKGSVETADEVDHLGKDGLKSTEATVTHIDRGAKTLAVKTGDGAEETYHLTDSAAKSAGKDVAEGAGKSSKVTLYYTEEAGHKVVHFFKRAI